MIGNICKILIHHEVHKYSPDPTILILLNCLPCVLKTFSRANVLCMLTFLCANLPCVLMCSLANVPCALRAHVPSVLMCQRASLMPCFQFRCHCCGSRTKYW